MIDAPSLTHLQGTQSRHTIANLAKELALYQHFWDTLCHGVKRTSILFTNTKDEIITGLAAMLANECIFSFFLNDSRRGRFVTR